MRKPERLSWLICAAALAVAMAESAALGQPARGAAAVPLVPRTEFERMMKDLSNWGRWGQDDQLGTINLITPELRKRAADLVLEGTAISLSFNPSTKPAVDNTAPLELTINRVANGTVVLDTWKVSHHGYTFSHLDALCHWSYNGRIYNGVESSTVTEDGCQKEGIEVMKAGILSRGVIVDIPRMKNVPYLAAGTAITRADVEAWERYAGVTIQRGDVVLFRTGRWKQRAETGPFSVQGQSAGIHVSVVPLLKERDVALAGSDVGLDVTPSGVEGVGNPVHMLVLIAMGTPIIDNADLEAVAETAARLRRPTFMFTGAPIPVTGGSGSLLNATAVF
jgi:kynurenine formamidase